MPSDSHNMWLLKNCALNVDSISLRALNTLRSWNSTKLGECHGQGAVLQRDLHSVMQHSQRADASRRAEGKRRAMRRSGSTGSARGRGNFVHDSGPCGIERERHGRRPGLDAYVTATAVSCLPPRRSPIGKARYRPISDIRSAQLATPKLPVGPAHRHLLEAPQRRAYFGRLHSG